jgi:hypothetical protein
VQDGCVARNTHGWNKECAEKFGCANLLEGTEWPKMYLPSLTLYFTWTLRQKYFIQIRFKSVPEAIYITMPSMWLISSSTIDISHHTLVDVTWNSAYFMITGWSELLQSVWVALALERNQTIKKLLEYYSLSTKYLQSIFTCCGEK